MFHCDEGGTRCSNPREFDHEEKKMGKTGCIFLHLTRAIYITGKMPIPDNVFCDSGMIEIDGQYG